MDTKKEEAANRLKIAIILRNVYLNQFKGKYIPPEKTEQWLFICKEYDEAFENAENNGLTQFEQNEIAIFAKSFG